MSGPEGIERRASDTIHVWIGRGFIGAVSLAGALIIYIFQGMPTQAQLAETQKTLEIVAYRTQVLTNKVDDLRDLRERQLVLEQKANGLEKRVDNLEGRPFSAFPPTGKR